MVKEKLVTLITVNYNQTAVTCALLDSIRRQDYPRTEVIVVDNASRENPETVLATRYPEVKYIRSEHNLGFAGGNNLAVPAATGDYLFFVNNDTELTDGCIRKLLALFEQNPRIGAASPLICYFNDGSRPRDLIQYAGMTPVHPLTARNQTIGQKQEDNGQFHSPVPTAYAHGAAMMFPRQVVENVGLMADDFFLYYEELDWGERVRRAGYEIWVEPRAKIYHKESVTVSKLGALKTYYLNRNRVWFMRRNFPGWRLWLFYAFLFALTIPKNAVSLLLRGERDTLRAFLKGIFWNFFPSDNEFEALRTGLTQTVRLQKQTT